MNSLGLGCRVGCLIGGCWLGACGSAFAAEVAFPEHPQVVDVTQAPYHARGDGVTDDNAALQRALSENVGRHRLLYFPPGTYLISATLTWPKRYAERDNWGFAYTTTAGGLAPMLVNSEPAMWRFFREICFNDDPFQILVRETRGAETRGVACGQGVVGPYAGRLCVDERAAKLIRRRPVTRPAPVLTYGGSRLYFLRRFRKRTGDHEPYQDAPRLRRRRSRERKLGRAPGPADPPLRATL